MLCAVPRNRAQREYEIDSKREDAPAIAVFHTRRSTAPSAEHNESYYARCKRILSVPNGQGRDRCACRKTTHTYTYIRAPYLHAFITAK